MREKITRAEFARRVPNKTRQFIYQECKEGRQLFMAYDPATEKISIGHPACIAFCAEYGYEEPKDLSEVVAASIDPGSIDGLAAEILALPFGEVIKRYGHAPDLREYVNVVKTLVATLGAEEEQARRRGDYVHREIVEKLLAYIDGLHKSLLSDVVISAVSTLQAQAKAGATKAAMEKTLRDILSRTIKVTKNEAAKVLKNA